jgi:hypothetical protein
MRQRLCEGIIPVLPGGNIVVLAFTQPAIAANQLLADGGPHCGITGPDGKCETHLMRQIASN